MLSLQSKYSKYVTMYSTFISLIKELIPQSILQKNINKFKVISGDMNIPEHYFNIVVYGNNNLTSTINLTLPTTDLNGTKIVDSKIMIISNFTASNPVKIYSEGSFITSIQSYRNLLNPFYILIFESGKWKDITFKNILDLPLDTNGDPIISIDIDMVRLKSEINMKLINPISQLDVNQLNTTKFIKFNNLGYDPEVYQLNTDEGCIYVKNGALIFRDYSGRTQNVTFPGVDTGLILKPKSQYKLENDTDSLEGLVIKDLLSKRNMSLQKEVTQFTTGISGKAGFIDDTNQIYLYQNVTISNCASWAFWIKPHPDTYTSPLLEQNKTIFSYGNASYNLNLYIPANQTNQIYFSVISDNTNQHNDVITYDFSADNWHYFLINIDATGSSDNRFIKIYINGNLVSTFGEGYIVSKSATEKTDTEFSHLGKEGLYYIDEMKYFDIKIEASKVLSEYTSYFPTTC